MKVAAKFFQNFFEQETPTGTVDGANTSFTLSATPVYDKALFVYQNGLIQRQGTDYTISGTSISFTDAPNSGTRIYAIYFKR
jgi:hypothetical protein